MKTLKVVFVFLILISFYESVAQSSGVWIVFEGQDVYLPSDYTDPSFPTAEIASGMIESPAYISYLRDHLFPLPDDIAESVSAERWWTNNRQYYPQFLPTGNPAQDSLRLTEAQEFWKSENKNRLRQLSGFNNSTDYSDEDYQLLCLSFPKRSNFQNCQDAELRYQSEVQEWIRIHSMQAYIAIKPVVDSDTENVKTGRN